MFYEPEKLRPGAPNSKITEGAAERIAQIAQRLRARGLAPVEVARFLDRVVFSLFAEDVRLLPEKVFTRVLESCKKNPRLFKAMGSELFRAMASGGTFGSDTIRHFNGNLFEPGPVLDLDREEIESILQAAALDWSAIDPTIFGTLFERGLDPDKRSQLGAHYTSREDIETIVEPVVVKPLRREWDGLRAQAEKLVGQAQEKDPAVRVGADRGRRTGRAGDKEREGAFRMLVDFLDRLSKVEVLDPACGSGNFLFVTLQKC